MNCVMSLVLQFLVKMPNQANQHGQLNAPAFLCASLRSYFHTKSPPVLTAGYLRRYNSL